MDTTGTPVSTPSPRPLPDEMESFDLVTKLCENLAAVNETIPKLTQALNSLVQLFSAKTGVFDLLKKQAEQQEGKPSEKPIQKPPEPAEKKPTPGPINIGDLSELAQQWLVPYGENGFKMKRYDKTGDVWTAINDELQAVAIALHKTVKWVSAKKESHWEVA